MISVVTIDGPAGAGKSTVAKAVARDLGWRYLDTGAMYRGMTVYALREGFGPDPETITDANLARILAAENVAFSITQDGKTATWIGDEHVPDTELRTPEVSRAIKAIADAPAIRDRLVKQQREIAAQGPLVTEGRDQGTVVFPDGLLKVYLTATVAERARRRWQDYQNTGRDDLSLEAVMGDVEARDLADRSRAVGALKEPPGALIVDTTDLTITEGVRRIVDAARAKLREQGD